MPHRQKSRFIPYSHTSLAFYLESKWWLKKKTLEFQVRVNLSILSTEVSTPQAFSTLLFCGD